ncbi:hypothetical protein BDZ89DRAFT_1243520 [Hymenopellis radicata]|nr:hypothetical protein BDZ89DRAFT_1243520 [Hymenopellis radicata]
MTSWQQNSQIFSFSLTQCSNIQHITASLGLTKFCGDWWSASLARHTSTRQFDLDRRAQDVCRAVLAVWKGQLEKHSCEGAVLSEPAELPFHTSLTATFRDNRPSLFFATTAARDSDPQTKKYRTSTSKSKCLLKRDLCADEAERIHSLDLTLTTRMPDSLCDGLVLAYICFYKDLEPEEPMPRTNVLYIACLQDYDMVDSRVSSPLRVAILASLGQPAKKTSTVHSSHDMSTGGHPPRPSAVSPAALVQPPLDLPWLTVKTTENRLSGQTRMYQIRRPALTTSLVPPRNLSSKSIALIFPPNIQRFPSAIGNLVKVCAGDALTQKRSKIKNLGGYTGKTLDEEERFNPVDVDLEAIPARKFY